MDRLGILEQGQCQENRIAVLLANHCAPVLCGIKIANLITLNQEDTIQLCNLCRNTDLVPISFHCKKNRNLVLLYHSHEMEEHMQDEMNWQFLKQRGFTSTNFEGVLGELTERHHKYLEGRAEFPHEMGVLLGYPMIDIIGFVENRGNNFLYAGYWKVYHNLPRAINTFCCYDIAKAELLQKVFQGCPVETILSCR